MLRAQHGFVAFYKQIQIKSSGLDIVIDAAASVTVTLLSVSEFAGLASYHFVSEHYIIDL